MSNYMGQFDGYCVSADTVQRVGISEVPFRHRIHIYESGDYSYPSPEESIFPIDIHDEHMNRTYQITRDENGGLVLTEVAQDE